MNRILLHSRPILHGNARIKLLQNSAFSTTSTFQKQANAHCRALVFPGQGSQYIGMGLDLYKNFKSSRMVFEEVDEALKFSLSKLFFEGKFEELKRTENAQPAIVAVGIAVLSALKEVTGMDTEDMFKYTLGHSVGEYTALIAAGSLPLDQGVRLVQLRGQAMKEAVEGLDTTMVALIFRDGDATINAIQEKVREIQEKLLTSTHTSMDVGPNALDTSDLVVQVATINTSNQITLSGNRKAVDFAIQKLQESRMAVRAAKLPVAAPFHCKLLLPAAKRLESVVNDKDKVTFSKPKIAIIANVTGLPVEDPTLIPNLLVTQTYTLVKWLDSIRYLNGPGGITRWTCTGPTPVMGNMIRREFPSAIVRILEKSNQIIEFEKILNAKS